MPDNVASGSGGKVEAGALKGALREEKFRGKRLRCDFSIFGNTLPPLQTCIWIVISALVITAHEDPERSTGLRWLTGLRDCSGWTLSLSTARHVLERFSNSREP